MNPGNDFYTSKELIKIFGSVKEIARTINKSYTYTYNRCHGINGQMFTVRDKELINEAINKSNAKSELSATLMQHEYSVLEVISILESVVKALKTTDEFYYSSPEWKKRFEEQ